MKKNIVFLIYFLCFSIFIGAQETAVSFGISQTVKEHIKARVDNGLNMSIAVGLIDSDNVEFYNYGKSALENGFDVDEHSVYEIGSITKVFTSILLAEKVLQGDMKLSDPIAKYLPNNVKVPSRNSREITLKDLATHSSGLPRMPDNFTPTNPLNPYFDYTVDLAYEFMSGHELARDIGSLFEYSNYGMGMLGHILELNSGKSYEELMVEKIADVFNMNDTRVVFTDNMNKHLARAHSNGREVENWDLPALAGAGAIRSTTTDMIKFLQANMDTNETIINKAMKLSHKVAYKNEGQDFEMGLGWHYIKNGQTVVWHNGGTGGYRAFAGFVEGTKRGVVVLTNSDEGIDAIGLKILDDSRELAMPQIPVSRLIDDEIKANGVESAIALYRKTRTDDPDSYDFSEGILNRLGYDYLQQDKIDIALQIFKLNVEMFPEASNPYDSLGEAYLKKGDSVLGIANYKKSIELNPANNNGIQVLKNLNVDVSSLIPSVSVPIETLDTYIGKYELQPNFVITISRSEDRLFLQATGQPKFEVFSSDQNKFYLKVVEANIVFNSDESGEIISLTLNQGGQSPVGKKIE
jgi:CubicO group peptidase (beta-lactamase class C family)